MARTYLLGSWNDADSYDYSGEQLMGHRQGKSVCVDHVLPNGKANLARYADNGPVKTQKKKIPISSKILSQNVTLNRVDQQEKELNQAFENSEIDLEEYEDLLYCLQSKRDRAHKSLCKALGRSVEDEEVGYIGGATDRGLEGPEPYRKHEFSSVSGSDPRAVVKDLKKDLIFFLTGSVVGLIILLTLTNT